MKYMRYTIFSNGNINFDESIFLKKGFVKDDVNPNVVFSFGGDGTMLKAIHKYESILDSVKFVGINGGTLGFFTSFEKEELELTLDMVIKNELMENVFSLLEYEIDKNIFGLAVNEITITNPIHTQIIDVYINGRLLETFRGTGILVSPPSGSTAYNKSLGGSVIDPNLKAFQLTEIASINNRVYKTIASPIILSESCEVVLVLKNNNNIYLSVDGEDLKTENVKEIKCRLSEKNIIILSHYNDDFWQRLKRAFI